MLHNLENLDEIQELYLSEVQKKVEELEIRGQLRNQTLEEYHQEISGLIETYSYLMGINLYNPYMTEGEYYE